MEGSAIGFFGSKNLILPFKGSPALGKGLMVQN